MIDNLNAVITAQHINITGFTVQYTPCPYCDGGSVNVLLLSGKASCCRCGREGRLTDFLRDGEIRANEEEDRRRREYSEHMGTRRKSYAKKKRGVWR